MKKLKLLKPWRLPTVRLKLEASEAPESILIEPVADLGAMAERLAGNVARASLLRCAAPESVERGRRAPQRRAIFASTASPHPGCPHQYS